MTNHSSYNTPDQEKKVYSLDDIDMSLTYSYAHYLNWLFDERVELINGKLFRMGPAPSTLHQEISGNLFAAFHGYLKAIPVKSSMHLSTFVFLKRVKRTKIFTRSCSPTSVSFAAGKN